MRAALILAAVAPLLMGQGLPRPRCDFGEGLTRLSEAERATAEPLAGLIEGRAQGERIVTRLAEAVPIFAGCGCTRLAELTAEAGRVAASLPSEASVARMSEVMRQAGFRMRLAREHGERQGCR